MNIPLIQCIYFGTSQVNPPTEFHLGSVSSSTATAASSMSTAVAADATDPSKRDFSNPMYEAMGDMESQVMNVLLIPVDKLGKYIKVLYTGFYT